jgi:murein L,D-transpeptidase YcbB/YkuD
MGGVFLAFFLFIGCGSDTPDASADASTATPVQQPRTYEGPPETDVAPAIRARLDGENPLDGDRLDEAQSLYADRDYRPIWTGSGEALGRADALLRTVANADEHGLSPGQYTLAPVRDALRSAYQDAAPGDSARAAALADADLHLTDLYFSFARDLAQGPFAPSEVGVDWYVRNPEVDLVAALRRALDGATLSEVLPRLASTHEGYRQLQEAIDRYEEIGSFPTVPEGDVLEEGDRSPRVVALRQRLAADGTDPGSGPGQAGTATDSVFDGQLVEALAAFQERHGLAVDSVLGPNTVAALNVPVEDRIRRMRANLVRWQWLPNDLGDRYIFVNLPEYRLHAYDGGEEVLSMGVIVGKGYDDRATPVFSDSMTYAEFRPYWNIPPSIVREEIVPQALDEPGYMEANNYEIIPTYGVAPDNTIPPTAANLRAAAAGEYRMRQEPGPENALGLVKYMFPNNFAIYLHDTPAESLFDRRERAFSHGCIRVEDPPALGAYVFEEKGWTADEIADKMQNSPPVNEVDVPTPIPVFILYLTAFVDDDGRTHFRDDLYGYDEPIIEALRARDLEQPDVDVDALLSLLPE